MRSRALVELDGGLVGMHVSGVDIAPRLSVSEIFELAPEEQAEFGEPKHSRLVCVGLLFADLECPIGPGTEIRPTGVVPFAHHFHPWARQASSIISTGYSEPSPCGIVGPSRSSSLILSSGGTRMLR